MISETEWMGKEHVEASIGGRTVSVQQTFASHIWKVGGMGNGHSASGFATTFEEAKRMAVLVAEAMPAEVEL